MNLSKEQYQHLFLAGGVPRRAQGLPLTSARGNKVKTLARRDTAEPPNLYSQEEKRCPSQSSICREASAEVTSLTLYLFLESSPKRAIPSTRGTDKAALPITAHRRGCPSHPTREQSVWLCLLQSSQERCDCCLQVPRERRKLGSKRNTIRCQEMLRITYFKSQTRLHRTWGGGGRKTIYRRNAHNFFHVRAVNSRPACQKQQCANNHNWLQNGSVTTTFTVTIGSQAP